jgi:hypothetical protein
MGQLRSGQNGVFAGILVAASFQLADGDTASWKLAATLAAEF